MAYPRFQRARAFKFIRRTQNGSAGNDYPISSTSWALVDSTNLVASLNCQVGDVIEVQPAFLVTTSSTVNIFTLLDIATLTGTTPINYFSSQSSSPAASGLPAWAAGNPNGSVAIGVPISASAFYTVQAGDIVNGQVTLGLAAAMGSAGSSTIRASSSNPLQLVPKNLGPVDPN
jgi:hypothetical protein